MSPSSRRRVVVTGFGLISPLGQTPERLWESLRDGVSGVRSFSHFSGKPLPTPYGAECWDYKGTVDDFGPLEKAMQRDIRKSLKVMCRGVQIGVASAQLALSHAKIAPGAYDPERFGVVFGCDYMMTEPEEFLDGVRACIDGEGRFQFGKWADQGLKKVDPLWLLKYLPNMPASHMAILNDLRGPNNSITLREASANLSLHEAYMTIERGHADAILAGGSGTRIHPIKTTMAFGQETVARGNDPEKLCRPFDRDRTGIVLGEGAASLILEEMESAQRRGAKIWGEIVGYGSSCVATRDGRPVLRTAVERALRGCLATSGIAAGDVGHIHAHGAGDPQGDADEAQAIQAVFGERSPPVVASQGHCGNLGSGMGAVQAIASLMATDAGRLFAVRNCETLDERCPIDVVRDDPRAAATKPGRSFISLNTTCEGHAAAVVFRSPA